ncbi:hypothetical protein VUR80DRAFT_6111 [Thermomyces stellatus]
MTPRPSTWQASETVGSAHVAGSDPAPVLRSETSTDWEGNHNKMPVKVHLDPDLLWQAAGKTVIITGGANGIGAATAALYNRHGASVVIADLPAAQPAADTLIPTLSHPDRAMFVPTNILDWAQMTRLFKQAKERFGPIDIVVANAAIMETAPVLDLDAVNENGELLESQEAFRVIDVNIKGTLNTLRLAMHHMRSSGGSVVMLASTSGYFGGTGVAAYVTSKHGVVGLMRACQAAAAKHGIRVNAVAPFFTPTHITASYAANWKDAGLEANTPEGVATVIVQTSLDEGSGKCTLACGSFLRELEGPRTEFMPEWVGKDVTSLMAEAGKLFESLGGYPLPKKSH